MPKRFIPRETVRVELNLEKPSEVELKETIIPDLKSRRAFYAAVRDGIRIIWELQRGETTTLYQLFPFLMPQPSFTSLPAFTSPAPLLGKPVVRERDEEERKRLSVQNTLASLEDF